MPCKLPLAPRVAVESIPNSPKIADLYPVLVIQDPVVGSGAVAKVLSDRFQKAIGDARRHVSHKTPRIWPLIVLTADDIDRLVAGSKIPGGHTAVAIFKRFHRTHPSRIISFGDFLTSQGSELWSAAERKAVVNERFKAATKVRLSDLNRGSTEMRWPTKRSHEASVWQIAT